MVEGKAKLVVDLGNSSTRVKTYFGKTSKGAPRSKLSILDNKYSDIAEDKIRLYLNDRDYSDETSRIFKYGAGYFCNGELCNDEFGPTSFRPTALEKKYESDITLMTMHNALRQGIEDVASMENCNESSVDVDWDVIVLLPPEDIDQGSKIIIDRIKSIEEIEFLMPDIKKNIRIGTVTVLPEGFCAFVGVVFEAKGVIREDYAYLIDDDAVTLIIDIGAGTTDISIANGSKIVKSTRYTLNIGGNNVHQVARKAIKASRGIFLKEEAFQTAMKTGYIKDGAKRISILREISDAKKEVSRQMVAGIQEFFESSMYPVRTISNLLVCGGGAESSNQEGIYPISTYLIGYMKRLSENIELVEYPKALVNGVETTLPPRLLNIIGAGIIAE